MNELELRLAGDVRRALVVGVLVFAAYLGASYWRATHTPEPDLDAFADAMLDAYERRELLRSSARDENPGL